MLPENGYYKIAEVREYIPEGVTIIIEAPQRYGKTLALTILAVEAHQKDRTIWTNLRFGFPHRMVEFQDVKLADGRSQYYNGHIAWDEYNMLFDARRSLSESNIEAGNFILQQKKQGCNITGTTHDLSYLDRRIREHHDFVCHPQVYPKYPKKPLVIQLDFESGPLQAPTFMSFPMLCEPFLGLYDTLNVFDPFKNKRKREREYDDEDDDYDTVPKKKYSRHSISG